MVEEIKRVDDNISNKQQFTGEDTDVDPQTVIFKDKFRLWNKITRVNENGAEVAVILPFNLFIEPLYSTDDIDTTISQIGIYDSANSRFRLYSDANGNYKYIQSKTISYRNNHQINSIFIKVESIDINGNDAIDGIDIEIFDGNQWIAINNGQEFLVGSYNGTDLDADLDTDLANDFSNYVDGVFLYQHKLKYRITRTSNDEVIVNKVTMRVTWNF